MSLTVNFSATQSLSSPNEITLSDTSTGTDGTITSRRVYLRLANGNYLVEEGTTTDYEVWVIGDTEITLDVLSKSQAINVTVQWLAGTTIVYQKTTLWGFDLYDYIFGFEKLQVLTSKPKLIDDENFYNSMVKLDVNIFCENIAITLGDDIYSAQAALDRNYYLISNQITFF